MEFDNIRVFYLQYDMYARYGIDVQLHDECFSPFAFIATLPLHFNYRILALDRGLTANYL